MNDAEPGQSLDDYDFELPEALIALRPAAPRSSARLLAATPSRLSDHRVSDLPELLLPGDLLVFNDTKVIPARLRGLRRRSSPHGSGEAKIEALLTERLGPDHWRALAKPGRRLALGDRIEFDGLTAAVGAKGEGGSVELRFDQDGAALDQAIAARGEPPLPPYIVSRRPADARDQADYQTIFAAHEGAVAAPTAALHFDSPLMAALAARGVETTRVTLHVGAGTFLPASEEDLARGRLHTERGRAPEAAAAAIRRAKAEGRRVIAVGTTAARVLETAAGSSGGEMAPWEGATDLFIRPGFRFNVLDGLLTNFHLPRSTLLMLTAAFIGLERVRAIYAHAIDARYRFYSYGDASLLLPKDT